MMTKQANNSTSKNTYHPQQLIELEKIVGTKLPDLLTVLGIEFVRKNKFYVGCCPIHGGDNDSALNLFHTGDVKVGNWRCLSKGCQNHFKPTIIGFVRGYISRTKYNWGSVGEPECSFKEAVQFLIDFSESGDISQLKVDHSALESQRFASNMDKIYDRQTPTVNLQIAREKVIKSLDIPAEYFVARGYTKEILDRYDVGLCSAEGREMSGRATVPIYDHDREMVIGCTGRSVYNVCPICTNYHNPTKQCPDKYNTWKHKKWRHNKGFKGENCLYNYWFAKEHIAKEGFVIIVESPGNVWRLEEAGIHNSVATFGTYFSEGHRDILDNSGALGILILTDPDSAGKIAVETITKMTETSYNLYVPDFRETFDVGENNVRKVKEKMLPYIEKVKRDLR